MKKSGKRYASLVKSYDQDATYTYKEAVAIVKKNATAKFDESFEIAIKLGVDPRKADQLVRGTVSLPHGTGKTVRVLVLAKAPKDKEALDAGAGYAGLDEYIEKIKSGWTEIDVIVATPDVMGEVGKLGRVLGPRGLMPNPKAGTVAADVVKAVTEAKAGKVEYRGDKQAIVHLSIGKVSFGEAKLAENAKAFFDSLAAQKPSSLKGAYVKSVAIATTQGPSIKVENPIA